MLKNKNNLIRIYGKKYAFNLDAIKEICLNQHESNGTKEYEISQAYERQDDGEFTLSSKLEHEVKTIGNQQNDMILYDVVKLFIVSLLENNTNIDEEDFDLGTALALNTMISWGVIYEVE
jgi:hypothetical protein